jgi:hypothetical protein
VTRARDERGQAAGLEAVTFGLLLFVGGSLLVANAWGVVDAKLAASAAAREAARAYVEASAGPEGAARRAAADAVAGQGRNPARLTLRTEGLFARCARVTAEARYPVPVVVIPWVGSFGQGITVRARHSEVVDPYRSDGPGSVACEA